MSKMVPRVADFYFNRTPPSKLRQNWRKDDSKGTPSGQGEFPSPEGTTTWVVPQARRPYQQEKREQKNPATKMEQPIVTDNPGSSKVIPNDKGFVNKDPEFRNAGMTRTAAKIADILKSTSPEIRDRAKGLSVRLTKTTKKDTLWHFQAGDREVAIEITPRFFGLVKDPKSVDIKVSCSCPFWTYQGPEYWAKQGGYLYGNPRGTASRPSIRDPKAHNKVCKHVVAAFEEVKRSKGGALQKIFEKIKGIFGRGKKSSYNSEIDEEAAIREVISDFGERQRRQPMQDRMKARRYYLRNRNKVKRYQKKRYRKVRRQPWYRRQQRLRKKYPYRYKRKRVGADEMSLQDNLIKLAFDNPELRGSLLPLVVEEEEEELGGSVTGDEKEALKFQRHKKERDPEKRRQRKKYERENKSKRKMQRKKQQRSPAHKLRQEKYQKKYRKNPMKFKKRASDEELRSGLIKLAFDNPDLRPQILPLIVGKDK